MFKLTEHTDRLFKSAEILDFKIPRTVEQIDGACKATEVQEGLGTDGGPGVRRRRAEGVRKGCIPISGGGEMKLAD